jgi:hypothetical protein
MRCKAEIYVEKVNDVLYVPIQAVHREGPIAYVYMPHGSGYRQHPVQIARSSDLYIEIVDSLGEGDEVLLRKPAADRVTLTLDETNQNGGGEKARNRRGDGPPDGRRGPGMTARRSVE